MDKLIITVTVDSTVSYPNNPYGIEMRNLAAVADEYVRSVEAGASIVHIHGVRELEPEIQPDGRKLSRLDVDGWRELKERIESRCDPLVQFGIAGARLEDRTRLLALKPDMMSVCFNAHDEHFQPDPERAANEIYASHPRQELLEYARILRQHNVRPEVECFHTGAFWNLEYVRAHERLVEPIWCTLFLGWPGGTWTPPTPKALTFLVDHLPPGCLWNVSMMDPPTFWPMAALVISMGGHLRVGWEDNPYLSAGTFAPSNVDLVNKVVRLAKDLGREVATPQEARQILRLDETT